MSTTIADRLHINNNPAKIAAEAIVFKDNDTLQDKYDNGDLGGTVEVVKYPIPTATSVEFNGSTHEVVLNDFVSDVMTATGDLSGTNTGQYSVTVSLKNKKRTAWNDDTTEDKVITWNITEKLVTPPTVTNLSFTYNGNSFSPTVGTYDSNYITVTNTAQTEPGDYTTTIALLNKTNTLWSDTNDTTDKTIAWSISKANPTLTSNPSSLALTSESTTGTLTFTTNSNGTFSASSANTDIATVSTSGKVVTVTGVASGSTNISGSVAASTRYNAKSISVPISCSFGTKSIGLLWDGSGFYRVDKDLNVISDSNFEPTKVFPFNQISTETVDGAAGVTWPTMYGSAETVPAKGTYGRVWWIDEEPEANNHVLPSFVADGETKSTLWLKSTLESDANYNYLCTKTKNTVMNCYDYSLLQKLILIYYNTGTNPPQNSLAADTTFLNLQKAWGHNYQWIFGADMIKSGEYSATAGNGNLRILNPVMDGSFIDTGLSPSPKWIKGNFNIETINGINMGDLMFDTSAEKNTNGSLTVSPFAYQNFCPSCAVVSVNGHGLLGLQCSTPSTSLAWRLRKCS